MTDLPMPGDPSSRLYFPALGKLYRPVAPFTETLIRIVAGLSLVPHGLPKLMNPASSARFLAEEGFWPGMLWAILLGLTETIGGLLLAAGMFTRLVCVPILIFLITAIFYHSQFGFIWNELGFEYPLFWAVVVFHFLINGADPYSVDRMVIRREF
jgi:putative oxidoreductase